MSYSSDNEWTRGGKTMDKQGFKKIVKRSLFLGSYF